jgi:hypothetical protein
MKALVVYESMFGNTAAVAEALAEGLRRSMEVEVHDVAEAPASLPGDVDLLVVAAPTHALSLSRRETRAEAILEGATHGEEVPGAREWLEGLQFTRVPVLATLDTRATKARHLPGSAARKAAKIAHARGLGRAVARASFYVTDTKGPLVDGELDRARALGARLVQQMATHGHAAAG